MSAAVPLLKFTPSAADPGMLEAITVQREPLIAELVHAGLDIDGGLRHHLLVGPRGIGKSHVLSLVTRRLRDDDRHGSEFVLAWLDEDPWAVRSYGKLLASVAGAVAEDLGDAELASRATALRASADADAAEQLLRDAVGGRRLILVVENLDEIFRRIGAAGQARFRAFAENWRQLLILGSTPQLFAGVSRHQSPFYGFFRTTHLDELTLENATELLRRVARLRDDPQLVEFLGTDLAQRRLRAVNALAGGHPRVWLLFAGCVSVPAIDELVPLFLEALDDLTPYYQDRLRELGDQQQELVVLLCEAGGALSNRDLAAQSGIAQNQIASTLGQLAERGYVRRATLPDALDSGDARMTFWELREPLMRLSLDVKQSRGEPLRLIVDFLRSWYGAQILDEIAGLPSEARLASAYATAAFDSLRGNLDANELLAGSTGDIERRAEAGLALAPGDVDLRQARALAQLVTGRAGQARAELTQILEETTDPISRLHVRHLLSYARRELGEPSGLEDLLDDAIRQQAAAPDDPGVADAVIDALLALGRPADALAELERVGGDDDFQVFLGERHGVALEALGRHEEALDAYDALIAAEPERSGHWYRRGFVLLRLDRLEEAFEAFTQGVSRDPRNPLNHIGRARALTRLARHAEAAEASRRAVELLPDEAEQRLNLLHALQDSGRLDDAERALADAIERIPADAELRAEHALLAWARGDDDAARERLRDAEPAVVCRIAWERYRSNAAVVRSLAAADGLSEAVLQTVPLFADEGVSADVAGRWVDAWRGTGGVAVAMLDAALAWKADKDRRHLLALPPEQREILVGLLQTGQ